MEPGCAEGSTYSCFMACLSGCIAQGCGRDPWGYGGYHMYTQLYCPSWLIKAAREGLLTGLGPVMNVVKNLGTVIHPSRLTRYCNAVYVGLPLEKTWKLKMVQNAADRRFKGSRFCHTSPILWEWHWLPMNFCDQFKVLVLTYQILYGLGPGHLMDKLLCHESASILSYAHPGRAFLLSHHWL